MGGDERNSPLYLCPALALAGVRVPHGGLGADFGLVDLLNGLGQDLLVDAAQVRHVLLALLVAVHAAF